jgi:hypothetical protein
MSDDQSRGPADQARIDFPEEAAFWTGELGCSKADLRRAVAAAGQSPGDVQRWLDTTYGPNFPRQAR